MTAPWATNARFIAVLRLSSRADVSDPERILIIRPSALGDVCRSVPVAASLRRRWPESRITWLVQRGYEDAVRAHPAVDEVVGFARREMARPWRPAAARRLARFAADLRRRRFDLVVDAQGLARSALIAVATRAPVRVGFAWAREGAWVAYTRRVASPADRHAVDRMLDLVEGAGAPRVEDLQLAVPPDAAAWWATGENSTRGTIGRVRPYAVLAPTARWRCKQWPTPRFAALGAALLADGLDVVLVGAPGEEAAVAAARPAGHDAPAATESTAAVLDLAGRTGVGQMMAVLDEAAMVVAGDSAALHMAAGLGTPAVALFGPTDPRLVGPRGGPCTVLRRVPADADPIRYRRLKDDDVHMRRLELGEVHAAVRRLLQEQGAPRVDPVPAEAAS